ncbi:unnamed protein product [Bemisia tabaci]|uniref:Uncharacterized protein n=1 Tax=Bemisia tabaci TaxID=7038 RepID=A0A9P0EZ79_BEMTA|nr:unnamed protein product [Bemisia tabaci]
MERSALSPYVGQEGNLALRPCFQLNGIDHGTFKKKKEKKKKKRRRRQEMRNLQTLFMFGLMVMGLCAVSWAQESAAAAAPPPPPGPPPPESSNSDPEQNSLDKDISVLPSFPTNGLSLLPEGVTPTAAVIGVVALAALLAASWPATGMRMCSLLGTCQDYNLPTVGTAYNNDAYSYSNPPPSVSYVEPILRLLSSAYLQYGDTRAAKAVTSSGARRQRRRR